MYLILYVFYLNLKTLTGWDWYCPFMYYANYIWASLKVTIIATINDNYEKRHVRYYWVQNGEWGGLVGIVPNKYPK